MQFEFAGYVLNADRRELTCGTDVVALGPQVFDVLLYLLHNRERVVSKDDLLDVVWKGRIVSESTLTSHINAARRAVGDNGRDQRLIRTIARKGFRFVGDVRRPDPTERLVAPDPAFGASDDQTALPLVVPSKPSIAIMPFVNLSGDPDQDYFADGVVEDLTAALSRIRWLFVIARASSFAYKGRSVEVTHVGRELGVRYILEGSIRKAANRVRITGQLIDAATGAHLWAERFDGTLDDLFDLQDQVTSSVVGAIAPQIEHAEIKRAKLKPTRSLEAYDYYLRALDWFHRGTRDAIDEALPLLYRAIELDQSFASAYGMAAWCYFWRKINGWMSDTVQETAEGARLGRLAVELGRGDAVALTRGGHALGHFGESLDVCIAFVDRALMLNPNLSAAWSLAGFQRISRGEPDDAIERFSHAMRLSPLDPETVRMQAGVALAHLLARRFGEASSWAGRALGELPSFLLAAGILAAAFAMDGRADEARLVMRRLREMDPALRLSRLDAWVLLGRPEDRATFATALRLAGLPE